MPLLEQLKKRYYAQSIRAMNSFDDIAISFVRCRFIGVDYFKTLDQLYHLNLADIEHAATHVDDKHRSVIRLLPKNHNG